jgi:hypothetical protein
MAGYLSPLMKAAYLAAHGLLKAARSVTNPI